MAKVLYLDRTGGRIDKARYQELKADPDYVCPRAYDNNRVRVTLAWIGRIENPQDTFPDYYKLFRVNVFNYKEDGTPAQDPSFPQYFPNEAAAVQAYEEFVLRWTKAERDEDGTLIEHDNALIPPPPPDPDKPASDPSDDDVSGVGAW